MAFHYNWLSECIKNQKVEVINPYSKSKTTYNLNPNNIHSIVLWSKDYTNFINNPGLLADYNLYFQYTITGYGGSLIEPNVPTMEDSIKTLEKMLINYKPEQFNIRFDPILFSKETGMVTERLKDFGKLCKYLKELDMISKCRITTSYISLYDNVARQLQRKIKIVNDKEQAKKFFEEMANISLSYGGKGIGMCCCKEFENIKGIYQSHCIDGKLLDELFSEKSSKAKSTGQREGCGCSKSIDIGSYNQKCDHNCLYCYAHHQ